MKLGKEVSWAEMSAEVISWEALLIKRTLNELINYFDLLSPVSALPGVILLGSW